MYLLQSSDQGYARCIYAVSTNGDKDESHGNPQSGIPGFCSGFG